MGIDRRGFLKFAVGAVVGLHLTPIPWKLMDDVAIWTQTWPWVPDPKDGAISYRNISGGLSDCGCGLQVRLVDNKRAVLIAGNADHPLSQGGVCPTCASSLQYFYAKDLRITSPMKRSGGSWIEIGWDEAMRSLSEKLVAEREAGSPQNVAMITSGADTATTAIMKRFMQAYGSPNVMTMPTMRDTSALVAKTMFGVDGELGYDLHNSDFVLSFGCDLVQGWGQGLYALTAYEKLAGNPKAKLVQVDTNLTPTASKAHQWIPVGPGMQGALAMALANVIIQENLYKPEAAQNTFGFDDGTNQNGQTFEGFKNVVIKQYDYRKMASQIGLLEQDVQKLAREFAQAGAPVAVAGAGKGNMPGDTGEFMAIMSLNALVGAVNAKGGVGAVPKPSLGAWSDVSQDDVTKKGLENAPVGDGTVMGFFEALNKSDTSLVNLLLVDGSNPGYATPNAPEVREAMKKIPYKVCVASFFNETVMASDLALPAATFLEQWNDLAGAAGAPFPIYQVTAPVFHPIYGSKATGEIFMGIAKDMGGSLAESFPWQDMEEVVKSRADGIYQAGGGMVAAPGTLGKAQAQSFKSADDLWGNLAATGCWYDPSQAVGTASGDFKTPTGKLELYARAADGAMVGYTPSELPGDAGKYPLVMMPYEQMWIDGSGLASAPYLTKIFPDYLIKKMDMFVNINPQDAKEKKINESDWLKIESAKGSLKVRAHIDKGVRPGVVTLAEGFGHTAFDEFMRGKGVNVRDIVTAQKDKLSGLPLWWSTRVNLIKI